MPPKIVTEIRALRWIALIKNAKGFLDWLRGRATAKIQEFDGDPRPHINAVHGGMATNPCAIDITGDMPAS